MTRCALPSFICTNSGQDDTQTSKVCSTNELFWLLDVNSLRPGQLPRDFLSFPGSKYWSMAIAQNLWFYRPVEFVLLNLTSWQVAVRSVPRQICPNPSEALRRLLPRLKPENGPFLPPLCQNVPQLPQLSKTHTNILSRFILHAWVLLSLYCSSQPSIV